MNATPERADSRANRIRLLCAAADLFAERGEATEIRDVAERAGLSVGAVYRHFPSKDDLIAAILDQMHAEVQEAVDEALAMPEPITALRGLTRVAVELALRRGGLIKAMLEAGVLHDRTAATTERKREFAARLCELIQRGIDSGVFRANLDPAVAAAVLMTAFQPWSLAALHGERTVDELVDRFVDLFVRGARA